MKKIILLFIFSTSVMSMRLHSVTSNSVSISFCNKTQKVNWKFCKELVAEKQEALKHYVNDNNIDGHLSISGIVDLDQDLSNEEGRVCTLVLTLDNSNKKITKKVTKTKNSWSDKKRLERLNLKIEELRQEEGHIISSSRFLSGGSRNCTFSPQIGGHEIESIYLKD